MWLWKYCNILINMAPVNQVILGNPLLSGEDFSKQLELMKQYEAKLQNLKYNNSV